MQKKVAGQENPRPATLKEEKDEEIIRFDLSICKLSAKHRFFGLFFLFFLFFILK